MNATTLFVIYENPRDYPGEFVCRRHFATRRGAFAEVPLFARAADLQSIRRRLPAGLYNLGRHRSDDPAIREVWI